MTNSQLKTQWPRFDLSMSSKVKLYKLNWKAIIYYMCFIQTFIIPCTVSEILAEIDHKGPNWTFLTLKMSFKLIPYLSYLRTGLVSQQRSYMMQYICAALCYYWIISIFMEKWVKSDLSDLENYLLNKSMKFISWQLITIIPKKLCTKNKEKLSNPFLRKLAHLRFFGPFRPWQMTLTVSDSIESIFWQVFEKLPPKWKMDQIWPLKLIFRMIKPNPHVYSALVPS